MNTSNTNFSATAEFYNRFTLSLIEATGGVKNLVLKMLSVGRVPRKKKKQIKKALN